MNSTEQGRKAEQVATSWLRSRRFMILDTNWRTRFCEIDIVAQKGRVVHFVEVKYRSNNLQGSGLDYINKSKLHHMVRGASVYMFQNNIDLQWCLNVAEVNLALEITEFIEITI